MYLFSKKAHAVYNGVSGKTLETGEFFRIVQTVQIFPPFSLKQRLNF